MKNYLIILFLFCLSCATPTVVNVIGPNDSSLTCQQLSEEIAKANKYADEAQAAKKMDNPHNIGAVLFFLPGKGVTMKNIEEAVVAANERALHLNRLKENKNITNALYLKLNETFNSELASIKFKYFSP